MAFKMADFLFRVILFSIFYLFLTPLGLVLRLFGKDYLTREFDHHSDSYWIRPK